MKGKAFKFGDNISTDNIAPGRLFHLRSKLPEFAKNEKALAAYNKVIEMQSKAYSEVRDALVAGYIREATGNCDDNDEEVIENFRNENKAKFNAFVKKANEDARFILPNASTTKIVCTFNARSLENFFAHRCCNRAQWEIRDVAEQMLKQ